MINIYINTECKHINNNTGIEEKGRGEGGGGKGSIENKGSCGVTLFITTV